MHCIYPERNLWLIWGYSKEKHWLWDRGEKKNVFHWVFLWNCISYILHCQHRAPFKIFQQDEGRCEYSQFTNEACSNFTLVAVIKYLDQKQHKEERAYLPSNSRFQSIKWGVTGEGAWGSWLYHIQWGAEGNKCNTSVASLLAEYSAICTLTQASTPR